MQLAVCTEMPALLMMRCLVCAVLAGAECAGQYSSAPAAFQACPEEPVGQVGGQTFQC